MAQNRKRKSRDSVCEGQVRSVPRCCYCGRTIARPRDPNLDFQPEQHGPGLVGPCPGCGELLYLKPVTAEGFAVFEGKKEDDR